MNPGSSAWKACSAIAHGNVRVTINYLSRQIVGAPSPETTLSKVSGNLPLLHAGTDAAVKTLRAAHVLYAKRSGHRPIAREPVPVGVPYLLASCDNFPYSFRGAPSARHRPVRPEIVNLLM